MKLLEKKQNIVVGLSSIIVFWGVKFLPLNMRGSFTLLMGIACIITAVYYFKKRNSREEFIFFSVLSLLYIIGSLIYIEHYFFKSDVMINVFAVTFFSTAILAFANATLKSYLKGEKGKFIIGVLSLISLLFIVTLIILKVFFRVSF